MSKTRRTSPTSAVKGWKPSKSSRSGSGGRPNVVVMPSVVPHGARPSGGARARRNPEPTSSVGSAAFRDLLGPGSSRSAASSAATGASSNRTPTLQDWDTPLPDGRPHAYPVRPRSSDEYRQRGLPMRDAGERDAGGTQSAPGGRLSSLQQHAISQGTGAAASLRDALSEYERGVLEGYEIGLTECGPLSGFTNFFRRRRKLAEFSRRRQEEIHQAAVAAASVVRETQQRERSQATKAVSSHGAPADANPMPRIPRPWRTIGAWRSLTDGDTVATATSIVIALAHAGGFVKGDVDTSALMPGFAKISFKGRGMPTQLAKSMLALEIIDRSVGIAAASRKVSESIQDVVAACCEFIIGGRCTVAAGVKTGAIYAAYIQKEIAEMDPIKVLDRSKANFGEREIEKEDAGRRLNCGEAMQLLFGYIDLCYFRRLTNALLYWTKAPMPSEGYAAIELTRVMSVGMLCAVATDARATKRLSKKAGKP